MVTLKQLRFVPAFALLAAGLAACAGDGPTVEQRYPTESKYGGRTDPSGRSDQTGIFGKDTLSIDLFGGKDESSSGGGIGVNGYLWRASLDTLAFMPLVSADPFGGAGDTAPRPGVSVGDAGTQVVAQGGADGEIGVQGEAVVLGTLHLKKHARVTGPVRASYLRVDKGASLVGPVRIGPEAIEELDALLPADMQPAESDVGDA